MQKVNKKLKAILCQLQPKYKDKKFTIDQIRQLLSKYTKQDELDIVVFPQMSFIGYNYKNQKDVEPYSVQFSQGIDFQFCVNEAKRLNSYIIFGYAQKVIKDEKYIFYNSAAVIDRKGNIILNTRKTHLYFSDQLWAKQGDGFRSVQITNTQGKNIKCAIGICMDIVDKQFTSGKYELGDYMKENQSQVLLFLTNWNTNSKQQYESNNQLQQLKTIYNYWLHRLMPLIKANNKKQFLLLVADRIGSQYSYYDNDTCYFIGGSCGIMVNHKKQPYIIKNLGRYQQNTLKIQVALHD